MVSHGFLETCCILQPIAGEPFPGSESNVPRHVDLVRTAFSLKDNPNDMWGISRRECISLQGEDNESEMFERIYTAHERYQKEKKLTLVEGTHKG